MGELGNISFPPDFRGHRKLKIAVDLKLPQNTGQSGEHVAKSREFSGSGVREGHPSGMPLDRHLYG